MDIADVYDKLPKYLETNECFYRLTIIKKDWDGYDDSCIVRYAKSTKFHYSKRDACLETSGRNLVEALNNMYAVCLELQEEGIIKGKEIDMPSYRYEKQFNAHIGIWKDSPRYRE